MCVYVCVCVCVYLSIYVSVCLSLASDSSETIEVVIIKLGTVTASDMRMRRVLIIWTLTFLQEHTDLNRENNTCSIISETVQAMPITFAVVMVRLKVYIFLSQSDDLCLPSQLRLKLNKYFTCNITVIYRTLFKPRHSNLAWR